MVHNSEFTFGDHLRHKLNGFHGHVVGILFRPSGTQYELLPAADKDGNWRGECWVPERYLELVQEKQIGL